MMKAASLDGRDLNAPSSYPMMLEEAGFVNTRKKESVRDTAEPVGQESGRQGAWPVDVGEL